jgi:hypothetical protein
LGASRFRTKAGIHNFGSIRLSDWLPVDSDPSMEQTFRGEESQSDDEFDQQDAELDAMHDSKEKDYSERGKDSDDDYDVDVERDFGGPESLDCDAEGYSMAEDSSGDVGAIIDFGAFL